MCIRDRVGGSESACRWQVGMECLSRRGASWGQEKMCVIVIGRWKGHWEQLNGKRLAERCECGECASGNAELGEENFGAMCGSLRVNFLGHFIVC